MDDMPLPPELEQLQLPPTQLFRCFQIAVCRSRSERLLHANTCSVPCTHRERDRKPCACGAPHAATLPRSDAELDVYTQNMLQSEDLLPEELFELLDQPPQPTLPGVAPPQQQAAFHAQLPAKQVPHMQVGRLNSIVSSPGSGVRRETFCGTTL